MIQLDALVVGAGFGGLGAALALAEAGATVRLCEALTYPGGCASTFDRRGYRFEAGATLSAGLAPDQPLRTWLGRHGVTVNVSPLDPVLELRSPALTLTVPRDREAFVDRFCSLPDAPSTKLRAFFDHQGAIAKTLWELFDAPHLLPPLGWSSLATHLGRSARYLPLLTVLGRPLSALVARYGLQDFAPLTTWLDAICQITVQCRHHQAEASFAIAAIDYFFHGAGHVHGGLGALAQGFVRAIEHAGGEVRFADRVRQITPDGTGYRVQTRSGEVRAGRVFANVLPQGLQGLIDGALPRLSGRGERVEAGWSACMLYLGLDRACPLPNHAQHFEIVQRPGEPLEHGNHTLVSVAPADDPDRAPDGQRVATVSTHIDPAVLAGDDPGAVIDAVHQRMREGLRAHLPEVAEHIAFEMTASPRTFKRFTRREGGLVGGVPRRVGLSQYLDIFPRAVRQNLYLVGDSVLLGQSVLATTLGGQRTAIAARGGRRRQPG